MAAFDQRVVLGLLLDEAPGPLTLHELAVELGGAAARVRAADALGELERAGLASRQGSLAFASRAAVWCADPDVV